MTRRPSHQHAHDLPPLWDGLRVSWQPWREIGPTTMVHHGFWDETVCTGCGWLPRTVWCAVGIVDPEPGATFTVGFQKVPAWPVARLRARRCPGCGLDQVMDIETGETWDLDEADYGDAGSWADVQTLF